MVGSQDVCQAALLHYDEVCPFARNVLGFIGTVPVRVIVAPYNRVAEISETNNVATAVTIRTRPDLSNAGGAITCADAGRLGDPAANPFYLVCAPNAAGAQADSNRVGRFAFALQPGSP